MKARVLGVGLVAPEQAAAPDEGLRARNLPEEDARTRRLPRIERMAAAAAAQALKEHPEVDGLALVVGTGYGGLSATADFLESVHARGAGFGSPTAFHQSVHHSSSGQISLLHGVHGPCFTVSAREISGEAALKLGLELLANGRARRVLVVAADERTPALDEAYRALDASARLSPTGEGAAAVLLEPGEGPLTVARCELHASAAPVLAFGAPRAWLPRLRASLADADAFSPASPGPGFAAIERRLAKRRELFEDAARFGFQPSAGLMRLVAAVERMKASAPVRRCVLHGLALGGGQALVELARDAG